MVTGNGYIPLKFKPRNFHSTNAFLLCHLKDVLTESSVDVQLEYVV